MGETTLVLISEGDTASVLIPDLADDTAFASTWTSDSFIENPADGWFAADTGIGFSDTPLPSTNVGGDGQVGTQNVDATITG